MDVVEDENPVAQGELEELAIADGEAAEGSGGGIDQVAEGAGEDGFAAGGGTSENEDGVGSDGAEGGGEPEQCAGVGALGEMEECGETGQGVGDWGLGIGRRGREGEHARGVAEGLVEVVGDGPALGGDFEDFAGGVRQVEEDFGWSVGIAFEADTVVDLLGGRVAVLGAGFEGAENGAEGERGGGGFEFRIVVGGDPVAEIGGANGKNAAGILGGDAGAGLAALGGEGRGGAGVVEESERLIGLAEKLGHACWFEGSGKMARCCGVGLGKLLRGWRKCWEDRSQRGA